MATIEFQLTSSGKQEVAKFFKDYYFGGMYTWQNVGNEPSYDAVFSRKIPFGTPNTNGVMTSSSFDVQMDFGDTVNFAVINSTAITENGKPASHYDMGLKTGQIIEGGYFPYGGIFRVNSITITVTSV